MIRFIGLIAGAAFIGAFAGTLLWINGRGAWFVMRYSHLPSFALSLSLTYILWLLAYGLLGAAVPLTVIMEKHHRRNCLPAVAILLISYVLVLLWYPLFYSAQFVLAALFVLFLAAAAIVVFFFKAIRKSLWLTMISIAVLLIQIYFICFTLSFFLLN